MPWFGQVALSLLDGILIDCGSYALACQLLEISALQKGDPLVWNPRSPVGEATVWDSGPFGSARSESLRVQRGARGPASPEKIDCVLTSVLPLCVFGWFSR